MGKNFENRLILREVIDMSRVSFLLADVVYLSTHHSQSKLTNSTKIKISTNMH